MGLMVKWMNTIEFQIGKSQGQDPIVGVRRIKDFAKNERKKLKFIAFFLGDICDNQKSTCGFFVRI